MVGVLNAQAPRCPLFPAGSPWHTRVDRLPIAANSSTMVKAIGPEASLEPHFGSGLSARDRAPIGHHGQDGRQFRFHVQTFGFRHRAGVFAHPAEDFAQIELLAMELEPAGVGAREKEEIFGDGSELMDLVEQGVGAGLLFRRRLGIGEDFFDAGAQK